MKNPFLEQQRQLLEMWAENVEKVPGMEAYAEIYRKLAPEEEKKEEKKAPEVTEYMKSMYEAMPGAEIWANVFTNPLNNWAQSMTTASNPIMDQWVKMMNPAAQMNPMDYWKNMNMGIPGMEVYTQMMKLWQDFQNPTSIAENYMKDYADLMDIALQGFMPPGVSPYLTQSKDLLNACVDLYQYLFSPWMDLDDTIIQRIAAGDTSAYIDFFKEFQDNYHDTFEKVFNMMGMGLNRESNEDYMRAVDAYFQALYAAGELIALLYHNWQESAKNLVSAYQEMALEGKTITTFKEFYDLWFKNTEKSLEELFDTDEFAKTFGNFSDMYAKYMIASNKVTERMLKNLPIPTKTDMDSLYKTVYEMRKAIRELQKEVEALKEKAAKPTRRGSKS